MSENEFRDALLRGQGDIDFHAIADRVGRRDRRLIIFLTVASIVAWMMVVMLPWATILPELARLQRNQASQANNPNPGQETFQDIQTRYAVTFAFVTNVVCMAMAAICTVSLILLSRRATLRQINSRLAELSAQLKSLDKPH